MGNGTKVAQHTPGPWAVVKHTGPRAHVRQIQIDGGGGTVVEPGGIGWEPDARLIAAAPDLLRELRAVEWEGELNGWPCCPSCRADAPDADAMDPDRRYHEPDCTLIAAIARATEGQP